MSRFTLLSLTLIFTLLGLDARTISGSVLSSNDSTAVIGASCSQLSDGQTVAGVATDTGGNILLKTELDNVLTLSITAPGYSSTDIILESGNKDIDFGTVYLDEVIALGELTVKGNTSVQSRGRTIVYPSAADIKASSTSISLFQRLPLAGLTANPLNRNITVDGGTPMILINGVPSTLTDFQALQPKDIEKVEYSRLTPARYADSGKSGLINVILKKRNDGGTVYLWGRSALQTAFVDANLNASYHQGPSQFSLQYAPSWRNYQKVYDSETQSFIGDDFRVDLQSHDRNPFNYHTHAMQLEYDYSPDAATLFSATFRATPYLSTRRMYGHTVDSELGTYDNNNEEKSHDFTPSLDLFLHRDFNEKNSIEVQVVGTLTSSDYRRDNHYLYPDDRSASYIMNVDSRRRSLISEISYSHTFSALTSLSAGYQNTVSRSTNTYLTSDYRPTLTENNNYVYAQLGQRLGKFYLYLSTGMKMFWINNDVNRRRFVRNLSSAQLSWNLSDRWSLQGSFRYTPTIPSLSALTDYPQQTTPYLVSNGNPDLKVADRFSYSISTQYSRSKFKASLRTSYFNTKNSIITDYSYLGDGLFLSQSINARYNRTYQNDLMLRVSDIHGFGASINASFSHYQSAGNDWSHRLNSLDATIFVWWSKGPFTVGYWRNFPGKYLSGHSVGKEENVDTLEIDWKASDHWTIEASWMYMFDHKGTRYPSWNYSSVHPSVSSRYISNNANMVVLSVSYTTDFGSIFRSASRSLKNSDSGSSLLKY